LLGHARAGQCIGGEAFLDFINLSLDIYGKSMKFREAYSDVFDGVRQVGECLRVEAGETARVQDDGQTPEQAPLK
jgi:hypothetical protein